MPKKGESPDVPMDLSAPDRWADPSERAHWREVVADRVAYIKSKGVSKGMALEIRDPEKAAQALYMIAEGASSYKINKALGIHKIQVDRLRFNNIGELAKRRADLAERFTGLAEELARVTAQKIDMLRDDEEQLKNTSLRDLVIAMGISSDHSSRMAGIPTTVVEHRSGPSVEDFEAIKEAARKRLQKSATAIEAEVIDESKEVETA